MLDHFIPLLYFVIAICCAAIVKAVNFSMRISDDEVTRLAEWADYLSSQNVGDLGVGFHKGPLA